MESGLTKMEFIPSFNISLNDDKFEATIGFPADKYSNNLIGDVHLEMSESLESDKRILS